MTPVALDPLDLALAMALLLAASGLSLRLSLQLHRPLILSALRMVAQLLLVGLVLRQVFALASPLVTLGLAAVMILAATFEVRSRQAAPLRGWWRWGIGALPVTLATVLVSALALSTSLRATGWAEPRQMIPLVGIILGTVMNSTSLALNTLLTAVRRERAAIEARLALGAPMRLALQPLRRQATHNGMIPVINQMAGAGVITLPGIMTGQIMAGMDPLEAAKYQILLLVLLATAGALGVMLASWLCSRAISDPRDRLRLDRLAP